MKPDLLEEVQRLIDTLESHPDPAVRDAITALLQGVDAVHRTALTHLVVPRDGAVLNCVHAENSTLRRIDDGRGQQ